MFIDTRFIIEFSHVIAIFQHIYQYTFHFTLNNRILVTLMDCNDTLPFQNNKKKLYIPIIPNVLKLFHLWCCSTIAHLPFSPFIACFHTNFICILLFFLYPLLFQHGAYEIRHYLKHKSNIMKMYNWNFFNMQINGGDLINTWLLQFCDIITLINWIL